ncbi:hypothetical protein [Bosea sp. BK604]|uniref:hypothetical protein n=1 Tax=Bosea sp. BK604 TaxID=2512180 RepID=UPI001048735F|nr:hypothetical protein [Bosea sp. BK604]TCR67390.1 hypothetical protein EV560_103450 [Bosea sp. BK604]
MAESRMPKPIQFAGMCALLAAAIFIATQHAPAPHQSAVMATTTPSMSPLEIMIRNNEPLPVEVWDAS